MHSNSNPSLPADSGYEEPYSKVGILYFQMNADGRVVSCNVTAQEILGYDEKEIIGKNFLILFGESDRPKARKIIDTCLIRGYIKDIEISMRHKEGRIYWMCLNGLTENDDAGHPHAVRFYAQNISDFIRVKKQKDLALRIAALKAGESQSQPFGEEIFRGINEIMKWDKIEISLGKAKGKLPGHWNDLVKSGGLDKNVLCKWSPETWNRLCTICQGTDTCFFTPQGSYWTNSISDLINVIQPGEERDCLVLLAEHESLVVVPILIDGVNTAHIVMLHKVPGHWCEKDVKFLEMIVPILGRQEDKRDSDSNRLSYKDLSTLDVPILGILLIKNGHIDFANGWIEEFLGLSQEEILGKTILDFIDSEYHERVLAMSDNGTSNDYPFQQCEVIVQTKAGRRRWVECAFVRLLKDGNSTELWYWINKEDRQLLKNQLLQARKMESLGLLAGGIVHDFNNLMACILGYSSLLNEEVPPESPYYEDIQQINQTAERAAELTSRLLAHTQGGEFVVNNLDVNQLIREVAAILSRTLSKSISIRAELEQEIWSLKADAGQIQQAILQVALNARDAMIDAGKMVFQTRNIRLEKDDVRLRSGLKHGRYVQISINDTGLGMSGHVKKRIFEPYFTTKDQTAGKGLGLSMVREIVENHGGFISVFSERDKGTVFKIHLPVPEGNHSKTSSHSGGKISLGKETILLVDDERVLRETARKMLTRYGYKVMSAENGIEAVSLYKKYISRIDLVILDLVMPGTETEKVINWLNQLNPRVKIIAASELGQVGVLENEFEQNFSGFIQKPFQVRPLLRTVRSVLNA